MTRSIHLLVIHTIGEAPPKARPEAHAMRCCSASPPAAKDRCVFTSVLLLGALFALSASPCARVPLVSALVIVGVPLMTFGVAAPSRVGLFRELGLFARGLESALLSLFLLAVGRRRDASKVWERQRTRVEGAYMATDDRLGELVRMDPLRLHHARRVAAFGTVLTVLAGMSLPLLQPNVFTFGDFPQAPFIILLDLAVLFVAGRVVTERISVRLLEASDALRGDEPWASRARVLPVATLLGAALGMVGSFVVVSAAAAACAVETAWIAPTGMLEPAFWFIRATAPDALPLGIGIGAILGAGLGLAQPPAGLLPERRDDEADAAS
jgi:hypothetical protein